MQQILVYGDSLSWGIIPNTRKRLPFRQRWPGVLETELEAQGHKVRVIENCLNGRRTVWPDPLKQGRDGSQGLAQVIEMHSPLALVILMLGSNDFQRAHDNNAWLSAQGCERLIDIIRQSPIEPGMPMPPILLIAPPRITRPKGEIAAKFEGAERRCEGLTEQLEALANRQKALFLDANAHIQSSAIDGIHLDADAHLALGLAVAELTGKTLE